MRGETESSARLINIFERLLDLCIRHVELLTFLIELFLARYFGLEQLLCAFELGLRQHLRCFALFPRSDARPDERNLIVHIFNRVLEFKPQTTRLSDLTAHRRLCHHELSLRRINGSLFDRDLHARWAASQ